MSESESGTVLRKGIPSRDSYGVCFGPHGNPKGPYVALFKLKENFAAKVVYL